MGTPYHHYLIADPIVVPASHEIYYSEEILRIPCYQPNDRKRSVAERPPTRAEAGLPDDAFVFCSFNATQKLTRRTFERWITILTQVPNSVLWMLKADDETMERLQHYAEERGIARERIVLAAKLANADHLARYPLADLFLDAFPYGAHTTAADSLWMGVPVLTLTGRSFAARVCTSLVNAAGIGEMACESEAKYVAKAVELANDRAQLEGVKQRLKSGRPTSLLFDTNRLARALEGLYAQISSATVSAARQSRIFPTSPPITRSAQGWITKRSRRWAMRNTWRAIGKPSQTATCTIPSRTMNACGRHPPRRRAADALRGNDPRPAPRFQLR